MRRVTLLLAGLVLLPLAVGCSANSQVIRSQSPDNCDLRPGQVRRAMRRDARHAEYGPSGQYAGGGHAPGSSYGPGGDYCPDGSCPGGGLLGGHCLGGGLCQGGVAGVGTASCFDCYWGNVPPTYPAPGAMPGIVQYPYYTCKGPDCFFHQE